MIPIEVRDVEMVLVTIFEIIPGENPKETSNLAWRRSWCDNGNAQSEQIENDHRVGDEIVARNAEDSVNQQAEPCNEFLCKGAFLRSLRVRNLSGSNFEPRTFSPRRTQFPIRRYPHSNFCACVDRDHDQTRDSTVV